MKHIAILMLLIGCAAAQSADSAQQSRQTIADFDASRKTAATALFRMAECHRQLHQDEQALSAYERVVREFSDQKDLAERSRKALAALVTKSTDSPYQNVVRQLASPDAKNVPMDPGPGGYAGALAQQVNESVAQTRYLQILQQQISIIASNLEFVRKQVQLGAVSKEELLPLEQKRLQAERELVAFQAEMQQKGGKK